MRYALYDPKDFFSILKEAAESPTKTMQAQTPFIEGSFPILLTVKYLKFKPLDFALRLIYSRYIITVGFIIRTYPTNFYA